LREGGPAGTGIKFAVGIEQGRSAADATVYPSIVTIPIFAGKGAFGALLSANLVLLRCQLFLPFLFGFRNLAGHDGLPPLKKVTLTSSLSE
jgi:hypothetical protein